ncbi:MAG: hypothetical protein K6E10_12355 [Eubacterium sp.]|nr:hypothetical protein [Eubacterium sp.]
MKKIIAFVLSMALFVTMAGCGTTSPKEADQNASSEAANVEINPALIKSVTIYWADFESGEWNEQEKWEYSYENNYPVSKVISYPGVDEKTEIKFEYTFEGENPVSMVKYENGTKTYTSEYVNGRLSVKSQYFEDGVSTRHQIYSYGNNDDFFTSILHSSHVADVEPDMPYYNTEEIDTIMVTSENGLLKKTVNDGLYTNWLDGEDREWMRFNGTYTVNYDAMGIVNTTECTYRDEQVPVNYIFDVTVADGRVTEAIRKSAQQGSTEEINECKVVFEYTDMAIDAGRYSRMINDHIMPDGNSFYYYNWY